MRHEDINKTQIVYAKQIAYRFNISLRTAYRWLQRCREWFGKDKKAPVTLEEFAQWLGTSEQKLWNKLFC